MTKKEKMDWLATAPNAAKKINEAQTALRKMQETLNRDASLPRGEEFPLYLNQFQEACYSVTISLDKNKKGWRKNLSQPEGELINFMYHQRGTETHNAGARALRTEMKSSLSSRFKEMDPTYFRAQWVMPHDFAAPTHEVRHTEYYFDTGTGRKEVIPMCDEYLAVLARQI